ncbi:hypothetical protein HPB51_018331 [Rhipicephalus microplus]|uniref:Uncharacterized protein n=1 Tax=Rhipicephalus microplus TaxID=6941 RepID=A0A9J6ETM1_RHIMP|nr:hypothetical protein HPB51_018331 [Rhipicephalus microplus]
MQAAWHNSRCDNPTSAEATEVLLRDTLPSTPDLQEMLNGLHDKDSALAELDKQIADIFDGKEFGEEVEGALDHHEKIMKAISRLQSVMNARATVAFTVLEASQSGHAGMSDGSRQSMEAAHSDTTTQTLVDHKVTIHTQPGFNGNKMFKYLKTYFSSAVKRTIQATHLTEAVKVLTEGFCRESVLIDDHIDSLLAIEPPEK